MARILVVDDDDAVLGVAERTLSYAGHEVITASGGQRALDMLARGPVPDLVILDIVMPAPDGIQVCRTLRTNALTRTVPILFLTARGAIDDRLLGLEAGADDYMPKPFDLRELELRVEALLRYRTPADGSAPILVGAVALDPQTGGARVDGRPLSLTPVEFGLLEYLCGHAGEVISSDRLLREVWGYPAGTGDAAVVRMHVLNLRRKLEVDPTQPRYLLTVPRQGYVLQAGAPAGA